MSSKRDLIVPFSLLQCRTAEGGALKMLVDVRSADTAVADEYGVPDLARRQLADKLRIPFAYFERMRSEQPALLDLNVNTWLQSDGDRRMIRTLDGHRLPSCVPQQPDRLGPRLLPEGAGRGGGGCLGDDVPAQSW